MVHRVFSSLCLVHLTTCRVWIYFQTKLGSSERFLKAKVPIKTIETVAHSFIKDLLASLLPRWKTSKVLYLVAMFVLVPALFSWGNSKSGTSWPRNSQSRSQPSPTLKTSKFSGRTKLLKRQNCASEKSLRGWYLPWLLHYAWCRCLSRRESKYWIGWVEACLGRAGHWQWRASDWTLSAYLQDDVTFADM